MSAELFGQFYETLMSRNSLSLEWEPMLADRCEMDDGGRVFTFHMNPLAHWSDGEPVTVEDVAWTFRTGRDHCVARVGQAGVQGRHPLPLRLFRGHH